jgi:hypothetical protein
MLGEQRILTPDLTLTPFVGALNDWGCRMSRTFGPMGYRLVFFAACVTGACHPNTPTTVQRTDPGLSTARSVHWRSILR